MAPIADKSALSNDPKASSVVTPNRMHSRRSAAVLSKLARDSAVAAAPDSAIRPDQSLSRVSLSRTSRGDSRASSGARRAGGQDITRNSPVEISTQASAAPSRTSA